MQTVTQNGRLKVTLTLKEARSYGLFESTLCDKPLSFLFPLYTAAAKKARFPFFRNVLCKILFNGIYCEVLFIPEVKHIKARTVKSHCLAVADSNSLLGLLSALYTMGEKEKLSLFENENGYSLYVSRELYEKRKPIFSEFCAERSRQKTHIKKLSDDAVCDIGSALHLFFKEP